MAAWNLIVLKFGGSVLRSAADLPAVADEIYRHLRDGKRVLAVVSAFEGQTDELLQTASARFGDDAPIATACFAVTGEHQSTALLAGCLVRSGVSARVMAPREIGLSVHGSTLEAEPHSIDRDAIFGAFERQSVLIVPGFYGINRDGQISLLGRGGSDYSALFLAHRLGAECRLIKNVAGMFDHDPGLAGPGALRFSAVTWDAALNAAGVLVQPRALQFAQLHRLRFALGSLSSTADTQVGPGPTTIGESPEIPPPLRIVLLGLGTVGGGVYSRLREQPERFDIQRIVVRDLDKHRPIDVPEGLLTTDLWEAVNLPADLIIECIGGVSPAGNAVLHTLRRGCPVVTANKTMVARYWESLSRYTQETPRLRFSAAVGGALPVLETLSKHAGRVRRLRGVINGTCTFVLDAMRNGADFAAAIEAARRAGFAESDPTLDTSGTDAAEKLALMARVAFGVDLPSEAIPTRGIAARDAVAKVQLVACAVREQDTIRARVGPEDLTERDYLAGAREAQNRVEIELDDGHMLRLEGKGAGRWPTTISVCGDVMDVWRDKLAEWTKCRQHPSVSA